MAQGHISLSVTHRELQVAYSLLSTYYQRFSRL
jgi:DNA repair exonuclease SbcCD ATPase subunit